MENVKRFIVSKRELKDAIVYLEYNLRLTI